DDSGAKPEEVKPDRVLSPQRTTSAGSSSNGSVDVKPLKNGSPCTATVHPQTESHRSRSLDSTQIITWEPSAEEKELIKRTWSDDFDFLYNLGARIYIYIFDNNSQAKQLFPTIHQHGEAYKESKEFRAQALKFVQTIAHAVKNVYHMQEQLVPHLFKVGERHVKFAARGFVPEHWDIFLDAMEVALADHIASIKNLDDYQRKEAVHVWRRLSFFLITHMKHGFFTELERQTSGSPGSRR
ncbi:Protein GLB-18 b, partial [Aphelenchoides avenae]